MPALTIACEYLTGYCVAAVRQDGPTEWSPHPGRVFMAMAAAWLETMPVMGGETGEEELLSHAAEGGALRWLESLGAPEMYLPPSGASSERSLVTAYVPVNDVAGPAAAALQSAPALTRNKQARRFPRRYVGDSPCLLHWPQAEGLPEHREALRRVCERVTRIGHSSSLVAMWVVDELPAELPELECWKPDDVAAMTHCRVPSPGFFASLAEQTQIPRIEQFAARVWEIRDAERQLAQARARKDTAGTKTAKELVSRAKAAYETEFGVKFSKSAAPPPRLRPRLGVWSGYRRLASAAPSLELGHSHFDGDLLILTHVDGPRLPAVSALAVTQALRNVVLSTAHHVCCGCGRWRGVIPSPEQAASCYERIPAWISGHEPDGSPSADQAGHLALLPLPFVGHEHADGHLLGAAFAFPENVRLQERGRILGPLLLSEEGEPREVRLTLGRLGVWVLQKRDWSEPRRTLAPETWTAQPQGADRWASVTPVVLDRFPKASRRDPRQRAEWEQEVREIVANACRRIKLPAPIHIDIDTTCWHLGSPRAVAKTRPLRGRAAESQSRQAVLGDGFPPLATKSADASRPQVHVFLQFAEPGVLGPVLLGAGRYRGYGVFKPWEPANACRQHRSV